MTYEQAKRMVKARLSEKRYRHTINVKKMAVKLAKKYGADAEKAAMAAILHDAAKEMPSEEMLRIFRENAIIADNAENRPKAVWHGICAAILAQTQWGIDDPEILSAIRYHTTGAPQMCMLDKIIFMADMTSAERDFPQVDRLRKLEMKDLDEAFAQALQMTLDFVRQDGKPVDPVGEAALQALAKTRERNLAIQ